MSRILLLGGTGAMGVYLSTRLVEMGHEVLVSSRSLRPPQKGITYLQGNAQEEAFLRQCLAEEPDAIVDFMSYNTEKFRARVDLLTTSTKHYVFLSSYRVFGGESPLNEESPRLLEWSKDEAYLKTDEYALTKARQEDLLKATGRTWTIVRPGITYSKERFQFGCLEANVVCWRALHGLPLVMPTEMLDKNAAFSWGKDVAEMIARLILNPKAYQETFIVASSERHTWREVFKIYEQVLGAKLVECSLNDYIRVCGNYSQVLYDRMFDRVIDNRKVLAATNLKQEDLSPLAESLTSELRAFKGCPHYTGMNWQAQARIDRITGTLSPLRGAGFCEKMSYYEVRYSLIGLLLKILRLPKRILRKVFK